MVVECHYNSDHDNLAVILQYNVHFQVSIHYIILLQLWLLLQYGVSDIVALRL